MKYKLLLFLLLVFSSRLFSQSTMHSKPGIFVSKNSDSLPYNLLVPSHLDSTKSYPLILWLHGKGERGSDNQKQMTLIKKWLPDSLSKEDYKSFLLAPQCSEDRMWSNYDKLANAITFDTITPEIQISIMELISQIKTQYKIDNDRIYIMGISMGGFGVFDMITRYSNYFAAAIPICGGADPSKSKELTETNIWAFHGEKDNVVNIRHTKTPMEIIENENHKFTSYPTKGHDAWNSAFKEINLLKWLFRQKK